MGRQTQLGAANGSLFFLQSLKLRSLGAAKAQTPMERSKAFDLSRSKGSPRRQKRKKHGRSVMAQAKACDKCTTGFASLWWTTPDAI